MDSENVLDSENILIEENIVEVVEEVEVLEVEKTEKPKFKLPSLTLFVLPLCFLGILGYFTWHTVGENWEQFEAVYESVWLEPSEEIEDMDFVEKLAYSFSAFDQLVEDNLYQKQELAALDGLVQDTLDKKFIRDMEYSLSVVKDNNDNLQFVTYAQESKEIFQRLEEFTDLGIPMMYVQAPTKYIEGYTEFPPTFYDQSDSNIAKNIAYCDDAGVASLDLRINAAEAIEDGILNPDDMFFVTDHHWTPETALWAVGETVDEIAEVFGVDYDPYDFYMDPENWVTTTYEQCFLGSQGRRVGEYYAGLDDFTLVEPNFTNAFDVRIVLPSNEILERSGRFGISLINEAILDMDLSVYTNRYACYWGDDYQKTSVNNRLIDDGSKILIIKDSYGLPYSAFFATMVDEVYTVDLRYFGIDSLEGYIKQVDPDLILMVYS